MGNDAIRERKANNPEDSWKETGQKAMKNFEKGEGNTSILEDI